MKSVRSMSGPAPTPLSEKEQNIKELFSSWDGSCKVVSARIKESLNNPDSYQHVQTSYINRPNGHIVVTTRFRATNGFGAIMTKAAVAEVTPLGNIAAFLILE
jgi:hypothetical protein